MDIPREITKEWFKENKVEKLNKENVFNFIKFHERKGNIVKNQKCKSLTLGETIEKSFININLIKREFYKLVKKYLKRRKIDSDFDFISNLIH